MSIDEQLRLLREGSYVTESSTSNSLINSIEKDLNRLEDIDTFREEMTIVPTKIINILKNYQKLIDTNEHTKFTGKILTHLRAFQYVYDEDELPRIAQENYLDKAKVTAKSIINELDKIISKFESRKNGIGSKISSFVKSESSFKTVKTRLERSLKRIESFK